MMNAEIISVGDELLIGQVVNTNASFIGGLCSSLGIRVQYTTTVGDCKSVILDAFRLAWERNDIVLVTGGLGPTHDDITRDAVITFFNTSLVFSEEVFGDIKDFLARLNRDADNANRDQAMVPVDCTPIRNMDGTAPGMHFQRDGKHFFVMPGVPSEMKGMMSGYIAGVLASLGENTRSTVTLMTTGIPESLLANRIRGVEQFFSAASLAYLPSPLGVRLRITAEAESLLQAETTLATVKEFIYNRAGEYIYAENERPLEEVTGELLRQRGGWLAVAESCTGGLLADKITNVPGSSDYFERGAIVYSNRSKTELLDVPEGMLAQYGAVSREVAMAMAEGIRLKSGADFALSTTGIAGPGGATDTKPVGLVWIGFSSAETTYAVDHYLGNDRLRTKTRAAQLALDTLRRHLLGLPILFPTELRMQS